MQPIKKIKKPTPNQNQGEAQDISTIWTSLGRIRTGNWEGDAEQSGSQSGSQSHLARASRKVVRIADRLDDSPKHTPKWTGLGKNPLPLARPRDPLMVRWDPSEESAKHVDFSRSHQLREVNWDGTYQDRLSFPLSSEGSATKLSSNSVIPDSHDNPYISSFTQIPSSSIPAAASTLPSFNNVGHAFSSPPFTPPPSISNSATDFHLISPPTSPSSSQRSSSSSLTSATVTEQSPDVRWSGLQKKPPLKSSTSFSSGTPTGKTGKNNRLRTTSVNIHIVNPRTGHPVVNSTHSSTASQKLKGLSQNRRQVDEKWTSRGRALDKPTNSSGQTHPTASQPQGTPLEMDTDMARVEHESERVGLNSPRLPAPFKMPITANISDDRIMLKLKDRLKQQRVLASSSGSGSNNSSLTCGSSSSATFSFPGALPQKLQLGTDVARGLEKPRKVAATHTSAVYRGFSEAATPDATNPWRPNSKVGGVRKGWRPVKQPVLQPKRHDLETGRQASAPPTSPERPKKMTRVIASGNKKSSKTGVANSITTSSWRAGQDLIMRELGLLPNTKVKSGGQGEDSHGVSKPSPNAEDKPHNQQPSEADAGHPVAGACSSGGDVADTGKAVEDILAHAKVLSRDAKSVLNDLKEGHTEEPKLKSPLRPTMKRKAPKSTDPEKHQQPSEKTRHYDQDSVRKFMAKQKAERLRRQAEERIANQKANERKQQVMQELAEKQKQAAKMAAVGRANEGDRKRKSDGRNKDNMDANKQDRDDNSTLTEDTGESTPRPATTEAEEDAGRQRKRSKDNEVGVNTNQHALSAVAATSTSSSGGVKVIEFRGQKMNLDVDNVIHQFSQVVKQRQNYEITPTSSAPNKERSSGASPIEFQLQNRSVFADTRHADKSEIAFALGTTNLVARTNEERKQAIKATALTLQSRLAEERRKMEGMDEDSHQQDDTSGDFMSRHSRIAGNSRDFAVFTQDLPGSHTSGGGNSRLDRAATQIQAAYRGHNVRQALNWEMPRSGTFGHSLRGTQKNKHNSPSTDDDDERGDTSTFSEVTSTEDELTSPKNVSGNRRDQASRHRMQTETHVYGKPSTVTYKPTSSYTWAESVPDPYSVMSVFSRQSRYLTAGSRQADMPFASAAAIITTTTTTSATTSSYTTNLDHMSSKQPLITSVEQTSYSQPVIARARYTRVEAVISEKTEGDLLNETRSDTVTSASESSHILLSKQPQAEHSLLFSSEEEEDVSSYGHQEINTKQESDLSAVGIEELRPGSKPTSTTTHTLGTRPQAHSKPAATAVGDLQGQREPAGRLSPNSLANRFSANLTYLESMEESLRQVIGMERTRSVALAQQETVSLAQILQSRQREQNIHLQSLQVKAHKEAADSSNELDSLKARSRSAAPVLLENEDNLRPEARSKSLSGPSRSSGRTAGSKETLRHSSASDRIHSGSTASVTNGSAFSRTARDDSLTSIKTAESLRNDLGASSRSASQTGSIPEEVPEEEDSYSISFDESFSEVLPSESHRKAVRRQSEEFQSARASEEISSHVTPYGDLSSLFGGGDSFNKFTADMVRQIMREEEYRAQHQAALLSLREKALKEKAKAELTWLQQLKQKPLNKAADDVFPNLDKRERIIRRNLQEQQAEIRRLQETNKIASRERQLLLQQHEEIARLKQKTQQTLNKFLDEPQKERRIARLSDVHTEDEMDKTSDVSEEMKDSKSDSEMYRDTSPGRHHKRSKTIVQKQPKFRLDEKYMTAREQKLHERQRHAKELLEWKQRLDAEEERIFKMEKKAIEAWEGKNRKDKKKEEVVSKKATKLVSASKKDDSHVISDRMLSTMHDELDGPVAEATSRTLKTSISEVISTQISGSKIETVIDSISSSAAGVKNKERPSPEVKGKEKSPTDARCKDRPPTEVKGKDRILPEVKGKERSPAEVTADVASPKTSGSEGSIPEEIPTGATGEKQAVDSSDDTLVNSSTNDDYMDTFEPDGSTTMASRKKSPVGRLLLQGSSPLPTPWSHRTGSESESEDSISHTETVSDVSDYEVRIRQLSDELRRRRKEIEILKKERSRRQKEKLKAQEEAMQKQLDVYCRYIQQLKVEKDELEHEPHLKTAVKPQIKQPRVGSNVKSKQGRRSEEASTSFEDMREGMREGTDSAQTSPSVNGTGSNSSPVDGKTRKNVSIKLLDRLVETSEPQSDRLGTSTEAKNDRKSNGTTSERTNSSGVDESIEELSHSETYPTEKSASAVLKIQTSLPAEAEKVGKFTQAEMLSQTPENVLSTASDEVMSKTSGLVEGNGSPHNIAVQLSFAGKFQNDTKIEIASVQKVTSNDISEDIEDKISAASQSVSPLIKSAPRSEQDDTGHAPTSTGIQESDSETESRVNTSAKSEGSSRPSSERSLGSMSYSPGDDEEEDDDIISYGSDRVPPRPHNVPRGTTSATTEDNISEHISASLPSISEKRQSHSGLMSQESKDILDSLLDYKEEEDADKTPVPTPREMVSTPIPEDDEENASLLATDPLVDFNQGDRVLVAGRSLGILRYKGKVDFSPGIWAGVELDAAEGESDGYHEGKRYFTCAKGHGVMVNGSDITAAMEKPTAGDESEEAVTPDESLVATDQDDSGDISDVDKEPPKTPVSAVLQPVSASSPSLGATDTQQATVLQKKDMTFVADSIVDHLTTSLVEDCLTTVGKIVSKKIPPPVLPKPTMRTSYSGTETAATTGTLNQQQPPSDILTPSDRAADGVMKSLLEEAISDILKVKSNKSAFAQRYIQDFLTSSGTSSGESVDQTSKTFLDDSADDDKIQDNDSGLSLDTIQRPGSPIPGDSPTAKDRKTLSDDLTELFGEYIDDDLDFKPSTISGKPPPPYPTERIPEEVPPLVPHTKEEITPIITRAVEIYWEKRRFGESLEDVVAPPDFLLDTENDKTSDLLTSKSRGSWKQMVFDLTGEIIQDIYKSEDKNDVQVWQKAKHRPQRFFHGLQPPTTIDGLQPIVHAAVLKLLGLNGTRKYNTVNKWNIRKKKDLVDSILAQELGEEEMGWVDYDDDELSLKMSLAESLFDSLLLDTVHTFNGIFQRRQNSDV